MITVTAFNWVPPFARGHVRDLRVRWALEEAGLAYQQRLIDFTHLASPEYRAQQPFGQVPVFEEDGLTLFESGSIALHIAERSAALLPEDAAGRARAITWVFAALNSMEVVIQQLGEIDAFCLDEEWAKLRRPMVEQKVRQRLAELAGWLGARTWLEDRFTVGDLMMTTVLRILEGKGLVEAHPNLKAWLERCEARPAFRRALDAQLASFESR